ncbi:hypothetical protein C8R47DRAFT_1064188 [Mycena vitilis]|nr:hypothetical protein C8R47DRAFT_1064188 [Mycena vitilis]
MAPRALQIPEICDNICHFLVESGCPPDLCACALVSPTFTSSAQRRIFRGIILISALHPNVVRAARSLCSVLLESPHLIRFIRDLVIEVNSNVVALLADVHLTHLETFGLMDLMGVTPSDVSQGASFITLPSVRHVELDSIVCDITSLCALFQQRTAAFTSVSLCYVRITDLPPLATVPSSKGVRLSMKKLHIATDRDPGWLLHPLCPLDFSVLEHLQVQCPIAPGIIAVMSAARSSLHTLGINCGVDQVAAVSLPDLPDFPALTTLRIAGTPIFLVAALSSLSNTPLLQYLTIGMRVSDTLDEDSFRRLDAVILAVDAPLRSVNLVMHLSQGVSDLLPQMRQTRALMPRTNANGYLSLTYTHNVRNFLFTWQLVLNHPSQRETFTIRD